MNIPVSSLFVADHGEHKGHSVIGTLDAAVGARLVGAGGNLINAEAVVEGEGKFGEKLESVVGKKSDESSPERDISIDKDVGRVRRGEWSLCSDVHVGAAAEMVRKKEAVGVAPRR